MLDPITEAHLFAPDPGLEAETHPTEAESLEWVCPDPEDCDPEDVRNWHEVLDIFENARNRKAAQRLQAMQVQVQEVAA